MSLINGKKIQLSLLISCVLLWICAIIFEITLRTNEPKYFPLLFSSFTYGIQSNKQENLDSPSITSATPKTPQRNITLSPSLKDEIPTNKQKNTSISPWIKYRIDWKGEELIQSNENDRKIIFTERYAEVMSKKGPHPLTEKYPKFSERLNYIYENCPNLHDPMQKQLNLGITPFYLHFNDDYEVINCLVPKAASDVWTKKFGKMKNPPVGSSLQLVNDISITNHMKDHSLTARRIQTYTKFFVRRHPFERLVSAFINKFEKPEQFAYIEKLAKTIIISNYLSGYPQDRATFETKFGHLPASKKQDILKQIDRLALPKEKFNITLIEFVNYITSSLDITAIDQLDIHWKPVSRICNPCAVRYDIVIDHDILIEESQMLVDFLQMNKPTNHPLYFDPFPRKATRDKCNNYFRGLSQDLRQKLYRIYRDDFLLFGYEYNLENRDHACERVD